MAIAARSGRIVAIDNLRGFVVVLVVMHHSMLAYCRYGHFDRRHYLWSSAPIVDGPGWLGFDVLVLFNDSFFMPFMFLLSGLFVWSSLVRKGALDYFRERLLRLGLPFAIGVVTLMPLAYYPSFRMTGANIGFAGFWTETVFSGPWPSGPLWFIAVLLGFDLAGVVIDWLFWLGNDVVPQQIAPAPLACFGLLVVLSIVAYLPLLAFFGPTPWFTFGPFTVQASRVGLYALYFFIGVVAGRLGLARGLHTPEEPLQRHWARWTCLTALLFGLLVGVQVLRLTAALTLPRFAWLGLYGLTLALFCAAGGFALLAIFARFRQRPAGLWGSVAANAYGVYIVHYPIVVWAQYAMLDVRLSVILKAALVFAAAVSLSWASVIALRRIPGARRVI
jgi:peptidoglycan/LPS O-acetylase OafA/YrhL